MKVEPLLYVINILQRNTIWFEIAIRIFNGIISLKSNPLGLSGITMKGGIDWILNVIRNTLKS